MNHFYKIACKKCGGSEVIIKKFGIIEFPTQYGNEPCAVIFYLCPCGVTDGKSVVALREMLGIKTFLEAKMEN